MAVWEQVSGQGYRPSAAQVKRLLTEERVPGGTAIARFVGVDAYEAAGGAVMRDLFARDDENGVWFEDPVLLETLAMAKLQAAADELATRWKWAIPMIEAGWDNTASYGRIQPQAGVATDEERAEIEKLAARYDESPGTRRGPVDRRRDRGGRTHRGPPRRDRGRRRGAGRSSAARTSPWPAASS